MRIEHATLDGQIIITAEAIEPAVPSLESLAAALQVIAERVGMSKAEADSLLRATPTPVAPKHL